MSPVRWGILGTANIARAQFLPALREAGGGTAAVVAGRDGERAATWAAANGVGAGVAGYAAVVEDPDVDAVYVALPNSLHVEWTRRCLEAGKAVVCEKPLGVSAADTAAALETAREATAPLWEAFVFAFQAQHARLLQLLADGAVGAVEEVVGSFHFRLSQPTNIRLSGPLGGGAVADVGCYPIRLAQELLGRPGPDVVVHGVGTGNGEVETEAVAVVASGRGRLTLSCGFARAYDTFARVLGADGQLHLTNPYHPRPGDTLTLLRPGADPVVEAPTTDAHSFTAALRHVHRVLGGEEPPRHLAVDDSLATAEIVEAVVAACRPT